MPIENQYTLALYFVKRVWTNISAVWCRRYPSSANLPLRIIRIDVVSRALIIFNSVIIAAADILG